MRSENTKMLSLKKNVGLIHCANNLSLLQRKIANSLLFNAYPELMDKEEHRIDIKYLGELSGFSSRNIAYLKKQLVSLVGAVHQWNILDDNLSETGGEHSVWRASAVLASAEIDRDVCTYSYSPAMRRLLYRPEIYGQIQIETQSRFKSSYGLVLYENCARYKSIGQTGWFDIDLFRRLMGVSDDKYRTFKDLNKRVISKAVSDVNQYAPFNVEPAFKRVGRSVTQIKFLITKSSKKEVPAPKSEDDFEHRQELADVSSCFSLTKTALKKLVQVHGAKKVIDKARSIKSTEQYKNKKILSLPSYLISALNNDYTFSRGGAEIKEPEESKAYAHTKEPDYSEEYEKFEINRFANLLSSKNSNFAEKIMLDFERHLGTTVYADIFARKGFDDSLIVEQFRIFLKSQHFSTYDAMIISCQEWVNIGMPSI